MPRCCVKHCELVQESGGGGDVGGRREEGEINVASLTK